MKKLFVIMAALLVTTLSLVAQDKYFTKSGKINFMSKAPLENIDASHKSVTCVLDTKTGNMQFAVLMKGFEFEKALMQEHFNENYVESHKYPKAEFKGQVVNNQEIRYTTDGTYPVKVKGTLTMHGETKEVETTGNVVVKSGRLRAAAEFIILLSDYKIEIPKVVKDNISNTVRVTVDCSLEPLKG
ncbi:MAG TPA: YceI family protein [Chitinophagaceae bacterium]|nr:YceI family protein [Chitinophagaceae bacterium]